jgi:hypothetical protein
MPAKFNYHFTFKKGGVVINRLVSVLSLLLRRHSQNEIKGVLARSLIILFFLIFGIQSSSFATVQLISAVPTSWRLQDYVGSVVTVWFTPSPCTYGNLALPSGSTQAEINRFWALILGAKLSNRAVYVYYDDAAAPSSCIVTSFGMDG